MTSKELVELNNKLAEIQNNLRNFYNQQNDILNVLRTQISDSILKVIEQEKIMNDPNKVVVVKDKAKTPNQRSKEYYEKNKELIAKRRKDKQSKSQENSVDFP